MALPQVRMTPAKMILMMTKKATTFAAPFDGATLRLGDDAATPAAR